MRHQADGRVYWKDTCSPPPFPTLSGELNVDVAIIGAGIVMALLAAVFGFIDFFGSPRIRDLSHAWQHMFANLLAVVVAAVNFVLRIGGEADAVPTTGLLLSGITVLILLFSGWRGGDLIYRHGVGTPE